jgi:hypothetical protein
MFNYLIPLILGVLIGIVIFYLVSRRFFPVLTGEKPNLASYSEAEVLKLLTANGYKILEKQKKAPIVTYIDDKAFLGFVLVNYTVKKDSKIFAAEIKTLEESDPTESVLRRKLLELGFAAKAEGIILLDLEQKKIQKISFKFPLVERELFFRVFIALFIVFVIAGVVGLLMLLKLF